jgi:hypothetical protein
MSISRKNVGINTFDIFLRYRADRQTHIQQRMKA